MPRAGLLSDRLARLDDVMAGHVDHGGIDGLSWVVARNGQVHRGTAGTHGGANGSAPIRDDSIYRIASMTKPVTAVAALILVEDCVIRLDEPVDRLLPELADRTVLADPHGPIDQTVAAHRPISVRDLLTFRLGLGMDLADPAPRPIVEAMNDLDLGQQMPAPDRPPDPDEWMHRLGTLPLERQPGERWLYHTGADVLGVLITRAVGQPLESFLRERIFEPLGMHDTAFSVPAHALERFTACSWVDPSSLSRGAERTVYDPPDGQWSHPPAFPSGGGGLVSTVDDFLAFAEMLSGGGSRSGVRVLSRPSVAAMTTDHLTTEQRHTSGPDIDGSVGWGFGLGVQVRRTGPARSVAMYGWTGALGSTWSNDPAEGLIGILLTTQALSSPEPPAVFDHFWAGAYASIEG